tara:strand:+ start:537 stop:905 length:369 start_codon:yes stop_codon:yes gene_type:complete
MAIEILNQWTKAINEGRTEDVASLYSESAVLVSTFSPLPINSHNSIRDYFINLHSRPGAGVKIDSESINEQTVENQTSILSGMYTFYFDEDGKKIEHEARFTFVVGTGLDRPILHHHSSLRP